MFRKNKKLVNVATKAATSELLDGSQPFAYTEAYKSLRTNLRFMTMGGELKKIVVTSAVPGEGKTTVSINLAKTLADTGAKVLLIDADLRNPVVHKYLRIRQPNVPGLSSLIVSDMRIKDAIGHLVKYNFHLILAGEIPPNPAELLGSKRMSFILEELEKEYDYIICDSPPVSIVTDAAVLSQSADGVIMVIGQGKSTHDQALRAKANLEKVNANILGAILNDYDASLSNSSVVSEYSYYYGRDSK